MSAGPAQGNSKYLSDFLQWLFKFPLQVSCNLSLQILWCRRRSLPGLGSSVQKDLSQCRALAPVEMATAGGSFRCFQVPGAGRQEHKQNLPLQGQASVGVELLFWACQYFFFISQVIPFPFFSSEVLLQDCYRLNLGVLSNVQLSLFPNDLCVYLPDVPAGQKTPVVLLHQGFPFLRKFVSPSLRL